jgi:hypothetical protein
VSDEPYRAPLPVTPPRREPRWPRIAIALAVGLFCGVPIAAGVAMLLEVLYFCGLAYLNLKGGGMLVDVEIVLMLLSVFCTPFVVGALTHRALGRPKQEARRVITVTIIAAVTVIFLAILGALISWLATYV